MVLSEIAKHLVPEALAKRAQRVEATAAEHAAQAVFAKDGLLARDVVHEVARLNAPFSKRAPRLVAEKYGKMAASPHAFFRGTPGLFYHDLARTRPELLKTAQQALVQGDLHLGNFGSFLRPNGQLAWGLVDVDEAAVGSAKAELLRLATSLHLSAREAGLEGKQADKLVKQLAHAYHDALGQPGARVELPKLVEQFLDDMGGKSRKHWLAELTTERGGQRLFTRGPTQLDVPAATADAVKRAWEAYRASLPAAEAKSLAAHEVVDVIAPVTGVSSLGRQRFRVLAVPKGGGEALVFDLKEELVPALAAYGRQPAVRSQADRALVAFERLNGGRAPLMGVAHLPGHGAGDGSFLVRQVEPWAGSLETPGLKHADFKLLAEAAGRLSARSHAAGEAVGLASAEAIQAELGGRKAFTQEVVAFARGYAAQVQADHAAFAKAVKGRVLTAG